MATADVAVDRLLLGGSPSRDRVQRTIERPDGQVLSRHGYKNGVRVLDSSLELANNVDMQLQMDRVEGGVLERSHGLHVIFNAQPIGLKQPSANFASSATSSLLETPSPPGREYHIHDSAPMFHQSAQFRHRVTQRNLHRMAKDVSSIPHHCLGQASSSHHTVK